MMKSSKYLAFSLAGAFFVLVCLAFGGLALTTLWSGSTSYTQRSAPRQHHQPARYQTWPVEEEEKFGGRLVANHGGETVALPTLKTGYEVDVRGDLVAVQVTQRFENPGEVPLDATYQFPLHEDAAVYAMTMRIGDEVVRAKIAEKDEARETYEEAKRDGKAAALTEQQRPNLFTQSVANLMPGKPVEIELRYFHTAERRDGHYHLTLPLVVGPRFSPGDMSGNELVDGSGDQETLAAHPPVQQIDAPETIDHDRVSLSIRIDAGMPLTFVDSETHELDIQRLSPSDIRAGLAEGRTIDNKHFELTYGMAGSETRAGLLADFDPEAQRGYFSLLIEPPATAGDEIATPREMVFVLDCSGSMRGQPMEASKAFMRRALRNLRPTDSFRIIRFSDAATEFSREPIEATEGNVEDALEYVDGLHGSGGTVMTSGIEQALTVPAPDGSIRLVTFMTDGYIGNEFEIVRLLREKIGPARLFAIGVGTGVNRYLIEEMARTGRGFARYVDPTEDGDAVAAELTERLQTPLLTGIRLRSDDSARFDGITPVAIPDLFAGESVRVTGTYEQPGRQTLTVLGNVRGRPIEIPVTVDLPGEPADGDAVRLTWARSQIADRMHLLTTPAPLREYGETDDQLQEEVTRLGLDHSLVTQWTSFVAVSDQVVNADSSANADAEVPVSQVEGVGGEAYASPAFSTPSFGGGSTPEPGILGGLLMTLLAAGGAARRRRDE